MLKPRLGIMQGRLSPVLGGKIQAFPAATWQREFDLARDSGFELMEWVLDPPDFERNPVLSSQGRREMNLLKSRTGIDIPSICCDYFMTYPLFSGGAEESAPGRQMLSRIMESAQEVGIRYVELPLLGACGLAGAGGIEGLVRVLNDAVIMAERTGTQILLETDLPPMRLRDLLQQLPSERIGVNYDMGNSAYWGFRPEEEIPLYGSRIKNVHIKDCTRADYSVALGTGEVNFDLTFDLLRKSHYRGDFVLQAARGSDDVETARAFARFSRPYLAAFET